VSQSIDVPDHHEELGLVRVTVSEDGSEFDWGLLFDDLLDIQHDTGFPDDPMVAIYYRDVWFYIASSDIESKATFSLLAQVFALHAGAIAQETPTLTIPITPR
jgi:hypothetical protein